MWPPPPTQVKFVLLSQPRLPENVSDSLDFVILYDVLVHVDLHITNKYIREIARVLKPGGKAFLSTANFLSPGTYQVALCVKMHIFKIASTSGTRRKWFLVVVFRSMSLSRPPPPFFIFPWAVSWQLITAPPPPPSCRYGPGPLRVLVAKHFRRFAASILTRERLSFAVVHCDRLIDGARARWASNVRVTHPKRPVALPERGTFVDAHCAVEKR